jgi:lipopolysaccharide export system permease protein
MFVYHRLNADSEIVAMRNAGISNMELAQPALIFGFAMTVVAYGLTLYAIPASMRDYHDFQHELAGNFAGVLIEAGVFTDLAPGVTFFAHRRDRSGGLSGIIVDDSRDQARRVIYTAVRGAVLDGAGGPRAVLQNGTYQETNGKTGEVSVLYFEQTEVGLGSFFGHSMGPRQRLTEELYVSELLSGAGQSDPLARLRLSAEVHRRLADPLYVIAMALIAAVSLVTSGLPRQGQNKQMILATAGASLLLVLSFVLRTMTQRLPGLGPIVYAIPTTAIFVCLSLLVTRTATQPRKAA